MIALRLGSRRAIGARDRRRAASLLLLLLGAAALFGCSCGDRAIESPSTDTTKFPSTLSRQVNVERFSIFSTSPERPPPLAGDLAQMRASWPAAQRLPILTPQIWL